MEFHDIIIKATPYCFLLILAEYGLAKWTHRGSFPFGDVVRNVLLGLGGVGFGAVASLYALTLYDGAFEGLSTIRNEWFGYTSLGWSIPIWVAAVLIDDFAYYWFHRLGHRVRFMWAAHVVHHSSEHFNFSTAVRLAWVSALYKPFFWVWIPALGFHPLMVLSCVGLSTLYQFACHTRFLPFLERFSAVMNTPGLHAIHHGRDEDCIDRNYAGVFSFYDRLFGTFSPARPIDDITFGVTHPPASHCIDEIVLHEFRKLWRDTRLCPRVIDRIRLWIKPPGWQPGDPA